MHTRAGGGQQQATSQEAASPPTTPPACHQQGPSPPSLSPACLAPAPPVTHPACHPPSPSPAPPVTRPACHWSCLTGIWVGGQEMGRRRPQGCGAGGPRDPVGPPLQLGILQHRHGNLSAATTFPNIPHPTHHRAPPRPPRHTHTLTHPSLQKLMPRTFPINFLHATWFYDPGYVPGSPSL